MRQNCRSITRPTLSGGTVKKRILFVVGIAVGLGLSVVPFTGNVLHAAAAFLSVVTHNATLAGAGTTSSPLSIANGGVGTTQLATGAVTSGNIANGAVGSTQLATAAITSGNIANGAVGASQLALGAVGSSQLALGAVGSSQLANGAVGVSQLATGGAPTLNQVLGFDGTGLAWATKPSGISAIYINQPDPPIVTNIATQPTIVNTLNLPPGNYLVQATGNAIWDGSVNTLPWGVCEILNGSTFLHASDTVVSNITQQNGDVPLAVEI
jgi:hypothetical protein